MQMSTQQTKQNGGWITSYYYENVFDFTDQRSADQTLRNAITEHTVYGSERRLFCFDANAILYTPCPRAATENTIFTGTSKNHKLVNWPDLGGGGRVEAGGK